MEDKRIIDMTVSELREVVRNLLREEQQDQPPAQRFATVAEAAEYFRVSPQTVRIWIREKGAPARRLGGGEYRVELDALAEWQADKPVMAEGA